MSEAVGLGKAGSQNFARHKMQQQQESISLEQRDVAVFVFKS